MVAIDNTVEIPASARPRASHASWLVLFALAGSALLTAGALVLDPEHGWRTAQEMVARFAVLIFVAAMIVEPLGRLIPALRGLATERSSLTLAFATALAASLVCEWAPSQFGGAPMPLPAVAYCVLTAGILVVTLFTADPATIRVMGAPAWRAMQRIATAYFWMVFALSGIEHLVGPHRPDGWYGFSLVVLLGALFIRFADSFVAHHRGMAGKVA